MEKQKTRRGLTWAALAVTLAFYLFVAWSVPCGPVDDFQWGLPQGVRWWLYGLLNGRYMGNLCAVLMCHFPVVKVLMMGGGMFAVPFLTAALMCRGERDRFLPMFLLSNALVMLMSKGTWTDLYGWVSGFGNYGVSTVVFLAFLLLVRRTHEKRDRLKLRAAVLFLTAFVMGLFVENQSIFFVGMTLVLGVYATFWDKPLRAAYWASFAGAVMGAVLMLSNGVLAELMHTGAALQNLRELTFDPGEGVVAMAAHIIAWYCQRLLPYVFSEGGCGIPLAMAVIVARGFWESRWRWLSLLGAVPLAVWLWIWQTGDYLARRRVLAADLCWLLTGLALLAGKWEISLKLRRILLYLVAPLVLLPLSAVIALGYRFCYFPMVVLVMLAVDLLGPVLEKRWAAAGAAAVMAALMLWVGLRMGVVARCSLIRRAQLRQGLRDHAATMIFPTDSYAGTLWKSRNPWNEEYAVYYRAFYGVPEDVTLIFLPGGSDRSWPEITEAQWAARLELAPCGDVPSSLPGG